MNFRHEADAERFLVLTVVCGAMERKHPVSLRQNISLERSSDRCLAPGKEKAS